MKKMWIRGSHSCAVLEGHCTDIGTCMLRFPPDVHATLLPKRPSPHIKPVRHLSSLEAVVEVTDASSDTIIGLEALRHNHLGQGGHRTLRHTIPVPTGTCNREFDCRFRHETAGSTESHNIQALATAVPSSSPNQIAPYLTAAGLAKLSGSGTDVFFTIPDKQLSPNEAHNHLKRFLADHFRFTKTFDIYGFAKVLASATSTNSSWTHEDGQLFLSTIASDNALLRLSDILCWPTVSMRAGSSTTTLSFQRGYLQLIRYFSSEYVVKSTTTHMVNALYLRIMDNFEPFARIIQECMDQAITAKSFKDGQSSSPVHPEGAQVMAALADVLFECLTRFKHAIATEPRLPSLLRNLQQWIDVWAQGISSVPPTFDDPLATLLPPSRDHVVNHLRIKISRSIAIVDREEGKLNRSRPAERSVPANLSSGPSEGIVAALAICYEGPGNHRPQGPRHDNDFPDIQQIRIAPTHDELTSRNAPFLPANFHDAPHHLPAQSMERILDIQFRLLREELTASLRTSVQLVLNDLAARKQSKTRLTELLEKGGGKYHGIDDKKDSTMFNVYTGVEFGSLVPDRRGLAISLTIMTPPGRARSDDSRVRARFWESMSGKRLMQGGLIALVWRRGPDTDVNLGIIASSSHDLVASAKENRDRLTLRIVFFDPMVELQILEALKRRSGRGNETKLLIEAPVMFEAIRPFLEALRVEPEMIPFAKYLVHSPPTHLKTLKIDPPTYSRIPGFSYELSSLFDPEAGVRELKMTVTDPASVMAAREGLRRSRMDASQVDAVVDTLTREISLIQGPPGTGKSFTGVELIRVLLANNVQPILMIAFTNHALDHILSSVLDAGITKSIVRLGSRSADERISTYSLDNIEMVAGRSRLDVSIGRYYRKLKGVEEEITKLMKAYQRGYVKSEEIEQYLEIQYPEHYEHICSPPGWVSTIKSASSDAGGGEGWQHVGKDGKEEHLVDNSMYEYWRTGQDLEFLQQSVQTLQQPEPHMPGQNPFDALADDDTESSTASSLSDQGDDKSDPESKDPVPVEESWKRAWASPSSHNETPFVPSIPEAWHDEVSFVSAALDSLHVSDLRNPIDFFLKHGCFDIPSIPLSDRPLEELLYVGEMWSLSFTERKQLDNYWTENVKNNLQHDRIQTFERLRERYKEALQEHNEAKDEQRRQLLKNISIVGCTTTGAAKLTSLLKGLAPRVMLVEEAGQVLEAHVLGSLVPSVEHLILIGDPLQLRPSINNYSLSMDNRRGRELFRFDMSLMERLATSGMAMSQIDVQRRMRPTISNLIRHTLYEKLQDHERVKQYPPVRGLAKNVFFLSHNHKESGGDDSMSRYNAYEVDMIKDLVLYLLRQGCYSQEGDIVVLCAYLGQLSKVRDALANEVAVVIDERDQMELADRARDDDENEGQHDLLFDVDRVKVSKRVRLRTVDNYQGEEAKIVILSLVRNSGTLDDEEDGFGSAAAVRSNIGFLKSANRTNVALSRAKEGLFILGNANNLESRSWMWASVIEELTEEGAVGNAFPVVCHQHPDAIEYVSQPGKLRRIAPDGGCLRSCDSKLKCGHLCPYKCHPDDTNHVAVSCFRPCDRLCSRDHPCQKMCSDPCGQCQFPISTVPLPCGHVKPSVPCYMIDDLSEVQCEELVTKQLPTCEHTAELRCSGDPSTYRCKAICGGIMSCCGRNCGSRCHECQQLNEADVNSQRWCTRIKHRQHGCQKTLFCQHQCQSPCSQDHQCTVHCKESCRQRCRHSQCKKRCSDSCAPCKERCTWICDHFTCPVPCGSVCARLPCDKRCSKMLKCGHRCPSVCGEDCSLQVCPACASDDIKSRVVDLVMHRTLEEIEPDNETLDELLITLPLCEHVFTVETLDGLCNMTEYYRRDSGDERWMGLEAPPLGFHKPPVCPTCRAAITSPRYGRVFKRADLDILELNTAGRMSKALNDVSMTIQSFSKEDAAQKLTTEAQKIKLVHTPLTPQKHKAQDKARNAVIKNERRSSPVATETLDPGNKKLHDVSPAVVTVWASTTKRLLGVYRQASAIAETRSSHIDAWQAGFSCLYQQEMDRALSDPSHAPRRPQEHAMRIARMMVGQPQPRADKRFSVEAIGTTLEVRFALTDLAQVWLKNVGPSYPIEQRHSWGIYISFIFDTCIQDAQVAYGIAKDSESRRQITTSSLFSMRTKLEKFRFNLGMMQQSGEMATARESMLTQLSREVDEAKMYRLKVIAEHISKTSAEQKDQERTWLRENFADKTTVFFREWGEVERSLKGGTFYQTVSLEEQAAVVRSFNFSHVGHFYNCPNGHTFVITECGGAMERSSCPECGEPIGGMGHTLDSTNRPATELENFARQQGALEGHWPWARGA